MVDARTLHRALFLAILVGLAFSLYASFEVLDPALQSSCSVTPYFSCRAVDESGVTHLGPLPDWSVGLGGFLLLLALDLPLLTSYDPRLLNGVVAVSAVGAVVALGLGYVELGVIRALCPVCLGAYLSDAAVLLLALALVRMRRGSIPDLPAADPPIDPR
ncbi:MAG: vitamin K epoxide reductase family protein [Thermoplasmata archaeon]